MGTIKDIADLTIDLINSTQDRKLTAKITVIQSLIATFQSEQSAIIEENLTLRKKNFELEQSHSKEITALQKKILDLEEKLSAKKSKRKQWPLTSYGKTE